MIYKTIYTFIIPLLRLSNYQTSLLYYLGNAEKFIEQAILIVTDYYLILLKCLIGEHYIHVKYIPIMNILCAIVITKL